MPLTYRFPHAFEGKTLGSVGWLPPARARTVIDAWADRTMERGALEPVEHVFIFENRGREIGVTLPHPHGQIYAFPFVPPKAAKHAIDVIAYDASGHTLSSFEYHYPHLLEQLEREAHAGKKHTHPTPVGAFIGSDGPRAGDRDTDPGA